MNKFLKNLRFIILYFVIAILLTGCNSNPTSVGSELLGNEGKLNFNIYNSQQENTKRNSYTYRKNLTLGVSDKLLLGKNSYAESYILLRFSVALADSVINKLKQNKLQLVNAWMYMKVKYSLGDKFLPFDFTVHRIRKDWGSDKFNYDSLKVLAYDASDISSSKNITDSLVTFNLSTDVVFDWLKYSVDSTSAPKNYGLLFKPTPNTQRFLGFKGYRLGSDSDVPLLYIVYEEPSVFKDTIFVSPYMNIHVVNGTEINSNNDIVLQAGLGYKGYLFFDLSSLPRNIIVNKATLELSVDSSKTIDGNPASDSIVVKILGDTLNKTYTRDSSFYSILSRTGNTFSGDISWIVQKWINGQAVNQGLELYLADEISSIARIWIHGSKSSEALRPRLKIYYIQK